MHRRDFLAAPLLVAPLRATEQPASKPTRAPMKVGTQHGDSDAILRVLAGFGVNHICSRLPSVRLDDKWSVESLSRFREHVESFGVTLVMVPLPMSSNDISRFELPNIMLGKSPDRDREIDDVCQMIRNTARAGIPSLKYFNVHFRNIRGRFLDFQETFIDDGDVDMPKAMRVYEEVGYDGMMMPDHVPRIDGDASEAQGFAFAFGYIKALIAAVSAEG